MRIETGANSAAAAGERGIGSLVAQPTSIPKMTNNRTFPIRIGATIYGPANETANLHHLRRVGLVFRTLQLLYGLSKTGLATVF
jgi:hypothetical protein